MSEGSGSRLAVGGAALVVLWIAVYWLWDPRDDTLRLSFDDAPGEQTQASGNAGSPAGEQTQATGNAGSPTGERTGPVGDPGPATSVPARPTEGLAGSQQRDTDPEPGMIAPQFRDYSVREGDTFQRIAEREFGDAALSAAIARSNPFKDPRRLAAGEVIRLPLDPANIQGVPTDGAAPPAPPVPVAVEYVVQRGDTLSEISQSFYGSTRYVQVILDANRGVLRTADELRVGQKLMIPSEPE
ncbi:MAG: LysM peptidoglycan-binding domain-containing protein [Planctomycetota bacterium]